MPNWCTTDYVCVGKVDNVSALLDEFERIYTTDRKEQNSDLPSRRSWLGYVGSDLLGLDPSKREVHRDGYLSCLAVDYSFCDKNETEAYFEFSTETAWVDCRQLFHLIAEKFDVDIFFITVELGNPMFETNDENGRFFTTQYILDNFDKGMSYYDSFEEVAEVLLKLSGESPQCFDEIEDFLEKHSLSDKMILHEISYVSIVDF